MSKLIEMGKKYTSNGEPVTIRYVDGKNASYPVLAEFEDGGVAIFSAEGEYGSQESSVYNLVEVSPYADWKIDQKIMVSEDGVRWDRRYFAGVHESGCCLAWTSGATSWTQGSIPATTQWEYARLPTPEELGEQT